MPSASHVWGARANVHHPENSHRHPEEKSFYLFLPFPGGEQYWNTVEDQNIQSEILNAKQMSCFCSHRWFPLKWSNSIMKQCSLLGWLPSCRFKYEIVDALRRMNPWPKEAWSTWNFTNYWFNDTCLQVCSSSVTAVTFSTQLLSLLSKHWGLA